MTYKQFKEINDSVKRTKSYIPVTLLDLITSQQSVQMDKVTTSQHPFGITVEGFVNAVQNKMVCATNPSKLAHWRGFSD